jgi:hypothetical protein
MIEVLKKERPRGVKTELAHGTLFFGESKAPD